MGTESNYVIDVGSMSTEEFFEHYGIKGMTWGLRRGKGVTGVTRHRGSLLDRNARAKQRINATMTGDKSRSVLRQRAMYGVGKAILGRERLNRMMKRKVSDLNDQDARLKSGKIKFGDRLDMFLNVPATDLVVSNRPK